MPDPWQTAHFYAILDTGYVQPSQWKAKARALIEGGAGLLQVRAKKESHTTRLALAEEALPFCRDANVPLIINDDLDCALALPDAGLHIGQDDLPVSEARARLGHNRLLGLSTHSLEQARGAIAQADYLDYFAVGPVFATATKPDYVPVGLQLVHNVASLKPPLPFFCIGGITCVNAHQVVAAGAKQLVAVSEVLLAKDTAAATRALIAAM
jgi:thiamine-phosphate pyrophosphorylase